MQEIIRAIKKYKRFLITAHINLEGDSLGSQLAMKELLERAGKEAVIVDSDKAPDIYKFLPRVDEVKNAVPAGEEFDAVMVVDCPTLKRVGRLKDVITKGRVVINVDHHISNENFGDINWVDANASSAGEMVYRLFKGMGIPLTKEIALYLYIAVLTDTGSFNYDNTSNITHNVASDLLGYGVEPAIVSEHVYESRSTADIKLLGMVLTTLTVNDRGDVAYLVLTRDMLKKTGLEPSRSEGFINYARSIDNVKVAIMFKEEPGESNRIAVSFRSKSCIDVNGIAAFFGGGGHMKASGCTIEGDLEAAKKRVLARVEEVLDGRNTGSR